MPRREPTIGYLRGELPNGERLVLSVQQAGRGYRISTADRAHLCHPSVGGIEGVKREALHVFGVKNCTFEPRDD